MINCGFHADSLKDMIGVFNTHASKIVEQWSFKSKANAKSYDTNAGITTVDLNVEINRLIISIMCQSAMGVEIRRDSDLTQISADIDTILAESDVRLRSDPTNWWSRMNYLRMDRTAAAVNRMESLVDNVVAERLDFYQLNHERNQVDFLDILLCTSEKTAANDKERDVDGFLSINTTIPMYESRMSSIALRDHVMTLFLAGHSTTSATLAWIIYELCLHPEIQTKCQQEVDSILFVKSPSNLMGADLSGGPLSSTHRFRSNSSGFGPHSSSTPNSQPSSAPTSSSSMGWTLNDLNNHDNYITSKQSSGSSGRPPTSGDFNTNHFTFNNAHTALSPFSPTPPHSTSSTSRGTSVGSGPEKEGENGKQKDIVYSDILKFEYLMQVIKETLRLHPSVPTIARKSAQDCALGEYKLKAGCIVLINTLALHRHPEYWVHPNDFDPDRFTREEQKNTLRSPFQYVPFSAGPRNCVGQRFAQMELIVILAHLLSSFTFSLSAEGREAIQFTETMTSQPSQFQVQIARRGNKEKSNVAANIV
eukprot:gene33713-41593_t